MLKHQHLLFVTVMYSEYCSITLEVWLKTKMTLKKLLNIHQIDVALLCETWLNDYNLHRIDICGYDLLYCNRSTKKGGGVCILEKDSLKHRSYDIKVDSSILEHISVEIKTNTKNLLLTSDYRPPNTDSRTFINEYHSLLKCHQDSKLKSFIGIDHNMDLLHCDQHRLTQEFLELNDSYNLYPSINKPTGITKSSATLIDNIFLNLENEGDCRSELLIDDLSDHLPWILICQNIAVSESSPVYSEKRILTTKSINKMNEELQQIDWHDWLQQLNCNHSLENFHTKLIDVIDTYAPVKRVRTVKKEKRGCPWISRGIINSSRKQKELYKKSLTSSDESVTIKYKEYRSCLKRIKRISKIMYYKTECESNHSNSKRLWQIINKMSGKSPNKRNIIDHLTINGIRELNSMEITKEFAQHFSTIGRNMAENIPPSKTSCNTYHNKIKGFHKSLYLYPATEHEVELLLRKLPNKNSSGHDNISNTLLKALSNCIITPLTVVFNKSLEEGEFPFSMKKADIVPLYKSKRKDITTNYRPISLLLTISKLLEKVMYKRTYNFIDSNGLLFNNQYGFRSNHSCEHAVSELVGNIVKNGENSKHTIAIFLDLSKAFDMISHNTLL